MRKSMIALLLLTLGFVGFACNKATETTEAAPAVEATATTTEAPAEQAPAAEAPATGEATASTTGGN